MISHSEYAQLAAEYKGFPRKKAVTDICFGDFNVDVPDVASFLSQLKEIFVEREYDFIPGNDQPVIVDVGSNIGLSVLFFSKSFPSASIYGYEADPFIFDYCERNLRKNNVSNVAVVNHAAWTNAEELRFQSTGTDAGHVQADSSDDCVFVQAIDFKKELEKFSSIDLLKIDIEGSENDVLPHIEEQLVKVKHLILEFHSGKNDKQQLARIIGILESQGYRYHIHQINKRLSPLINREPRGFFDCQINIFCYRPDESKR